MKKNLVSYLLRMSIHNDEEITKGNVNIKKTNRLFISYRRNSCLNDHHLFNVG